VVTTEAVQPHQRLLRKALAVGKQAESRERARICVSSRNCLCSRMGSNLAALSAAGRGSVETVRHSCGDHRALVIRPE
jgi:hypothetical protein